MLTRFIIGFTLGAIIVFNCACGLSISDTGNHAPTQWVGIPIDEVQAKEIYDYTNIQGGIALNHNDHQDHLGNLRSINFVANIFPCDAAVYGPDVMCFGITYDEPRSGDANSQVALVVADYTQAPTTNLGCTAMVHEMMHTMSWNLTGNADMDHTNPAVWGSDGMVAKSLEHFCPQWNFTPNNLNPPTK